VAIKRKREREREREIDPSGISFRRVLTYAARFSTYFHSRRHQTPTAVAVKIERSKSDRLYLAEKRNFILFRNSLTGCIFYRRPSQTYFGWRDKFRAKYFYRRILYDTSINIPSFRFRNSIERRSRDRCCSIFKSPFTYVRSLFRL